MKPLSQLSEPKFLHLRLFERGFHIYSRILLSVGYLASDNHTFTFLVCTSAQLLAHGTVRLYMVSFRNMGLSMTHMFKVVQFTCTQDWVAWLLAIGCFHQFVSRIWCVRLQWSVHVSRWEILLLLGSCLIKCPTRTLSHGI